MNELSNEELDQLFEYAMEAMFIMQEEKLGDTSLFPSNKDLSLLDTSQIEAETVENMLLHLLLCSEFEQAIIFLEQALTKQSKNPVFQLYLALSYYVTGKMPKGIAIARTIDFFALISRENKNEIILAFLPNDDFPVDFPKIIDFSLFAHNPELQLSIRKLCTNIQLNYLITNYPQAIAYFQQLLPLVGDVPDLLFELAHLYSLTDQHKEAKKLLTKILQQNSQSVKAHYLLATTHRSLGEYEQAIGFFWKYLKLEPDDFAVLVPLIVCYEDLNLTEKAVSLLEQALEFCPQLIDSGWRLIPQMDKLSRIVLESRKVKLGI